MNEELIKACILACQKCAAACEQCAVSCSISARAISLTKPLELSIYCADMCRLTVAFLRRGELQAMRFCSLCSEICEICAQECDQHDDPACRSTALACMECVEECRKIAAVMMIPPVNNSSAVRESA